MKKALALTIFCCLTRNAYAAEVDIAHGQLKHAAGTVWSTQVIAAKNNGQPIKTLTIECGFFQGDRLLAAGRENADNVAAGQTVYIEIIGVDAASADRTDCRVSDIQR